MADIEKAKQAASEIDARHREIAKLENSLKELHDMFVDLALLVTAQVCILLSFNIYLILIIFKGEMIDNIEHNVLKTQDFVGQAAVEVKKVKVSQDGVMKVSKFYLKKKQTIHLIIFFYRESFISVLF
jgi:t-SNARE complex subunit (syntaxin)